MPYFLDGNNLIGGARRTATPTPEDASALIAEVADRLRRTRASAVLFFDGAGGARATSLGRLSVRHAGSRSADDAIVTEVQRARAPHEVIVVTADRVLGGRVREAGARCISPEEFWGKFGAASKSGPSQEPPPVDVEEWIRYFGDLKNRS